MKKLLQDIIGKNGIVYRLNHMDTIDPPSKAYYITFNNTDRNNIDYWSAIIKEKLLYLNVELFFNNNNIATLWIEESITKERKFKLKKLENDNKK